MKEFWNDRYGDEEFAYGTEPNSYFKEVLNKYNLKGDILLPAEGEGRNAVFASKLGLNVTCFDMSEQGKLKALKLAKLNNVTINYLVENVSKLEFKENSFDVIALIFAHFPSELKSTYYKKVSKYLKPGGVIIFEGFSKKQLQTNKHNEIPFGPPKIDMLFSIEEVENYFSNLRTLELKEEEIELNEGIHHKGIGSVIRFIGKK